MEVTNITLEKNGFVIQEKDHYEKTANEIHLLYNDITAIQVNNDYSFTIFFGCQKITTWPNHKFTASLNMLIENWKRYKAGYRQATA